VTKVDLSSKDIICNFRRLPSWIISRVKYEEIRSGIIAMKEFYSNGNFLKANGKISNADTILRKSTSRKVSHWIRVEYIEEDFINVFSSLIKITASLNASISQKE